MHKDFCVRSFLESHSREACRPIPFWSWNDRLDPQALREQIGFMDEAGMGGFFMHARSGLETEYMGDEWFRAVEASVDEGRKRNMEPWCYDENGWPSGFAGGKLLEDPENWAHFLRFQRRQTFDPDALGVYCLQGNTLKRVTDALPSETEYLCVYDCKNSSNVDILNPQVTDAFLELTHAKYAAHFSRNFSQQIAGFFTDEPQYFRYATAYTPQLLTAYPKAYGSDLLELLGALLVSCEQAPGFRFRYWRLMARLYTDNFMARVHRWCRDHGCRLTGHTIEESEMFAQMWCCAGVMPFYEYEDIPCMDWLGRSIGTDLAPRQVSSAAMQLGKKQILTETFAMTGWDVTPIELKRIAEWQCVNGVNLMCYHLYPYSIRGQRKRDYPAFYSKHNPWTDQLRTFNSYFTDLGCLLANSQERAEVLLLHPIHSAYLTFDREHDEQSVRHIADPFRALISRLSDAGICHHYGDEILMERHGRVSNGKLHVGFCSYSCVIIPDCDTLDHTTADLLRQYLSQGGKLLLAGRKPARIDGELHSLDFLESNLSWAELVRTYGLFSESCSEVRCTLRETSAGGFAFLVNLSQKETRQVVLSLPFAGAVQYDLIQHTTKSVSFSPSANGINAALKLLPGESVLLVQQDTAAAGSLPVQIPSAFSPKGPWDIAACSPNGLTLDQAALSFDGLRYSSPMPVPALSDLLLRRKQNGPIWLRYSFRAKYIPQDLYLELENLYGGHLYINGTEVFPEDHGILDPSFLRVPVSSLIRSGTNEIVLTHDYIQSDHVYHVFNGYYYGDGEITETLMNCLTFQTNIEAIYLFGSFGIQPENGWKSTPDNVLIGNDFYMDTRREQLDPRSITSQGFAFFRGSLRLRKTVCLDSTHWQLRCSGRVQYVRVFVNSSFCGTLLLHSVLDLSPFLRCGDNTVELELMSSNRNLFGPHHWAPCPEPFHVGPHAFSFYGSWDHGKSPDYRDDYAFVPFGLDTLILEKTDQREP